MAGIGFALRKLTRQDNLMGSVQAYLYSALITTGPWLFTIIALTSILYVAGKFVTIDVINDFRRILIYNFAFSLITTGPLYMVVTRFMADSLYRRDVSGTPGLMLGALIVLYLFELPLSCAFYLGYANLEFGTALTGILNYMLISTVWMVIVFISALHNYVLVTAAFGVGMFSGIVASFFLAQRFGSAGILNSFSFGLAVIVAILISRIFSEYPYPFMKPFEFLKYFKPYYQLALNGLFYNLAAWIDKILMWFAPEADRPGSLLNLYPNYDTAMFLAYISIIPAMAMFTVTVETSFFEKYIHFFHGITDYSTLAQIRDNHKNLLNNVLRSSRNFLVLQLSICVLGILTAPRIFSAFNINFMQIGIFRFGIMGAFFQIMIMFLSVLVQYFDQRAIALRIQVTFFLTNTVFTLITLKLGFKYYGAGYFYATLFTFIITSIHVMAYTEKLIFHTFVTNNIKD
ncbi:MAG: exopolysaccharide Pel transporter PelG [SAR324 cluster bacterium]|nr:exopolysaccharide Pel transporter PelG [SAR324 cluster bacterium]